MNETSKPRTRNPNAPAEIKRRIAKLKRDLRAKRKIDNLLQVEDRLRDALRLGGW